MELSTTFERCVFKSATIRAFIAKCAPITANSYSRLVVKTADEEWTFDDLEEFFAAYDRGFDYATIDQGFPDPVQLHLTAFFRGYGAIRTDVEVTANTRAEVEGLMAVFRDAANDVRLPPPDEPTPPAPEPPIVFIGHGHSAAWRDLKDHLHEQHGYDVEAYETGARAGHAIRDILQGMTARASFAVLVMTGEDEQADGTLRARENVVHEIGLFQGTLGFDRAVVAIEDGVEPFSNLQGIQQLRFSAGNLREIYGDVLATLRREFDR